VDTTAPTFQSAASSADGTKVILTYDEALNATTAAVEDFVVQIDDVANAVTAVSVSGSTVELTLTTTVANGNIVTVAYPDPTGGDDADAIQDAAGNVAVTIPGQAVTNNLPAPIDTSIVVFDLVNGVSSDHSSRTFDANVSYTIYLVVNADSAVLMTEPTGTAAEGASWGGWLGAVGLGGDDKLVLVSDDGAGIEGRFGSEVIGSGVSSSSLYWYSSMSYGVRILEDGGLFRSPGGPASFVDVWDGEVNSIWRIGKSYGPTIPGGVLSSQGLV
jgi:uncharacterized repeat protein (TIGR02059 family)